MALLAANSILLGLSGMIGGQLVFKQYQGKTVVSAKPTRCRRKPSELQQLYHNRFAEASKYARTLLRDPAKYEHYTKLAKKHRKHSAYNFIISEYMLRIRQKETASPQADKKQIILTRENNYSSITIPLLSPSNQSAIIGPSNSITSTHWGFNLPHHRHLALPTSIFIHPNLTPQHIHYPENWT